MDFCYLIMFESTGIKKIESIEICDDDPKLLEKTFEDLGYDFKKPLKRQSGFSKIYNENTTIYYKIIPCLKISNRFFELKELL